MIIKKLTLSFVIIESLCLCTVSPLLAKTQRDKGLDCVDQHINEIGEVLWNDVCSLDNSEKWTKSRNNTATNFTDMPANRSRQELVSNALDQWDEVERRHERLLTDMSKDKALKENYSRLDHVPEPILDETKARENVKRDSKAHSLDLSWEIYSAWYHEPHVMEQSGTMNGYSGRYTYRPNKDDLFYYKAINYYRLDGMFASGRFDYQAKGDQEGLKINNIYDYMVEIRGIIGKEYIHEDFNFLAYSGFGHRFLNDEETPPTIFMGSSVYGYERESRYYYLPFGFEVSKNFEGNWTVTANGEYDWFLTGRQVSEFSDANKYLPDSRNEDVSNRQDSGYGMRGSIKFLKSAEQFNFFVEPFIRYWKINDSEIKTTYFDSELFAGLEPENQTLESGVKLGMQF